MAWTKRARWLWAATASVACALMIPAGATAKPMPATAAQGSYAATSAYERLQTRAIELESLALAARDQAKIDERHGGRDDVTHRMDEFAEHAHDLGEMVRKGNADTSKMNDRIRKLMDDASAVQREWAKSKRRNPQTVAAWNRALEALTDVNNQYLAANGLAAPRPETAVGTSGTWTTDRDDTWESRRETLTRDLARQAERAERLSRDSSFAATSDLADFSRQVSLFADPANARLSVADVHGRIVSLLFDAQQVQQRLGIAQAPAELRDQVNAMVGTLVQMRNLTGDRSAYPRAAERDRDRSTGTSGYGQPPAGASDSLPSEPAQILVELNQRTLRASELASDSSLYEVSGKLRDFRDRLREFDRMSPQMDRDGRRDRLDSLLREAQERQRDLAEQHAPLGVVSEWNSVVALLARLRNAS